MFHLYSKIPIQKTTNKNPRSTVGTITEIYDYLRLVYARIGIPYCPVHKKPIKSQSIEEMTNQILNLELNTKIRVMSPTIHGEKGTFKDTLEGYKKDGYVRVRIDNEEYWCLIKSRVHLSNHLLMELNSRLCLLRNPGVVSR